MLRVHPLFFSIILHFSAKALTSRKIFLIINIEVASIHFGGYAENCVFSTSRALSRSRTAIRLRQPSPTFRAGAELFAFCMVMISVITLTVKIMRTNKKTKPPTLPQLKRFGIKSYLPGIDFSSGFRYNYTEICYRSGFANLSHFIRCFENQFGVPPGAYARKEREKEP